MFTNLARLQQKWEGLFWTQNSTNSCWISLCEASWCSQHPLHASDGASDHLNYPLLMSLSKEPHDRGEEEPSAHNRINSIDGLCVASPRICFCEWQEMQLLLYRCRDRCTAHHAWKIHSMLNIISKLNDGLNLLFLKEYIKYLFGGNGNVSRTDKYEKSSKFFSSFWFLWGFPLGFHY